MRVEEEFFGLLLLIERKIVLFYQENPTLLDFDVQEGLGALDRCYRAELDQYPQPQLKLSKNAQVIFDTTQQVCEGFLGRKSLFESEVKVLLEAKDTFPTLQGKFVTIENVRAGLKRLEKSIKTWTKKEGSRGYLNFTSKFVPKG